MGGELGNPASDKRWWAHASKLEAQQVFTEWFDVVGEWVARRGPQNDPRDLGCFTIHAGGGVIEIGQDLCRWLALKGVDSTPVWNLIDGLESYAGLTWGKQPNWEELSVLCRRAEVIRITARLEWLSLVEDEEEAAAIENAARRRAGLEELPFGRPVATGKAGGETEPDGPDGIYSWRWKGELVEVDADSRMKPAQWKVASYLWKRKGRIVALSDLVQEGLGTSESSVAKAGRSAGQWFDKYGIPLRISASERDNDISMEEVRDTDIS